MRWMGLLFVIAGSSAVHADGASVSGEWCVGQGSYDRMYARYSGQGVSPWGGDIGVACPVSLAGEGKFGKVRAFAWARAVVRDASPSTSVSCYAAGRSFTGAAWLSSVKTTSTSFAGYTTLSWTNPFSASFAPASLSFHCSLPNGNISNPWPDSKVLSVGVGE